MTRIDELQKKYPTLPRDFIIKWEVKHRGVKDTEDLDKVSYWTGAQTSYQIKFDDETLLELIAKRPSRMRAGRLLRPAGFWMKSSVMAELWTSTRSPYEIKEVGENKFALYEGDERIDVDLYFPRPKPREGDEPVTSRGTPISKLVSSPRNCVFFQLLHHCEYFTIGEQCKFCQFNPSQDWARSLGITRPVSENPEDVLEAVMIRSSEVRLLEIRSDMGGLMDAEKEGRIYLDIFSRIASAVPYESQLIVQTQAMGRKDMQRLKDAGLSAMSLQMETWEPQVFAEVVPGKAKHASYAGWMEALSNARDVFGAGNVTCKTLGGLTLIPPCGHTTWQEARDSHIEHNRSMIKQGIFPAFGNLTLPPGSAYGANPANRAKIPPTEYYLEVAIAHHAAMMEFGLYDKLNKFLWCGFDCGHALYAGELGVLALAGNWGNWMRDVSPDKSNWILQWLSTINSTKQTN